jgi:hypothetical protein
MLVDSSIKTGSFSRGLYSGVLIVLSHGTRWPRVSGKESIQSQKKMGKDCPYITLGGRVYRAQKQLLTFCL